MTSKRKILPRIPRRFSFHNVPAAFYAGLYAKQKQVVAAAAAAQSPKNGANFDCLISRELNQNPCLKSIPNHGKLYEFVAMKYDTSRSDIVSCNSCSTESSYDSSMSSESFDVQRELQEMREEHGEELSIVGDILTLNISRTFCVYIALFFVFWLHIPSSK
ncbi:uncharacterized protein LOC122049697 [Zingiber officinale]|uniref:Uncharacterized protein n=1 Tax=Zingiber officinale TaxID=94328 RepID=A0A8J5LU94_ZINOF|nr:uncharacterized protein LOC122040328 [Zingiber officinale]XP_042466989.1 uncharacterized protein LOC122049697 [Zingiber officinale]KAG6526812.1 hypothetical protein ZIOFF_016813 [Zingiber officinale]KAG6530613.1 hypothetical protein ZIOFF_012854 [Zingiber officinale]